MDFFIFLFYTYIVILALFLIISIAMDAIIYIIELITNNNN